jgi:hypothetical protein
MLSSVSLMYDITRLTKVKVLPADELNDWQFWYTAGLQICVLKVSLRTQYKQTVPL